MLNVNCLLTLNSTGSFSFTNKRKIPIRERSGNSYSGSGSSGRDSYSRRDYGGYARPSYGGDRRRDYGRGSYGGGRNGTTAIISSSIASIRWSCISTVVSSRVAIPTTTSTTRI